MTNEADGRHDDTTTHVIAVPLGLLAGVVIGMLVGNLALGLALGLCIGALVSSTTSARRRPETTDDQD